MKRLTMTVAAGMLVMACGGCSSAIKEGARAAMGGRGYVAPLSGYQGEGTPLSEYQNVELGELRDSFGGVPQEFFNAVSQHFQREVSDAELPTDPGGRTVLVRGEIIHYEGTGMVDTIVSPMGQVVVRAEMVDKGSGEVLATANLVGRIQSRLRQGPEMVAEGYARAVVKWLSNNYFAEE
ncbi:MAG: hypothetical protein ACLFV7_13005 [Phycisphaerae bacterium]